MTSRLSEPGLLHFGISKGDNAMKGPGPARGRRPRWRGMLHRVAKSHYTHLATGVLLVLTAVLEIVDGLFVELSMKPESHHALLALGGVLMARSIVDIVEGMEYLDEANEDQGRGSP